MQKNRNQSHLSRRKALGLLGLGTLAIQLPMACNGWQSNKEALEKELVYYKTISEISKMIKSGEITSTELCQLMLNRIAMVDKKLNSYLIIFNEEALAAAAKLDKELAYGKYRGPLHGIPVAVKDLLYTSNAPTTGGHAFKANFVPGYNATVINKLQMAGAVI